MVWMFRGLYHFGRLRLTPGGPGGWLPGEPLSECILRYGILTAALQPARYALVSTPLTYCI